MNAKIILLCFGMVLATNAMEIGNNPQSLLAIVAKLCWPGNHSDDVSAAFFACYDVAPGKEIFSKCQMDAFGRLLNTHDNVNYACTHAWKMGAYATCLKTEFAANPDIDNDAAVTAVNKCQAKAVGL